MPKFPHCDALVLHAPGECEYCDLHTDMQQLRLVWGINFTGQYEAGKYLCPSEEGRSIDIINRWYGNRPKPPPRIPTPEEVEQARSEIERMLAEDGN